MPEHYVCSQCHSTRAPFSQVFSRLNGARLTRTRAGESATAPSTMRRQRHWLAPAPASARLRQCAPQHQRRRRRRRRQTAPRSLSQTGAQVNTAAPVCALGSAVVALLACKRLQLQLPDVPCVSKRLSGGCTGLLRPASPLELKSRCLDPLGPPDPHWQQPPSITTRSAVSTCCCAPIVACAAQVATGEWAR